ncbi:MAG: hypothetical protein IKZ53_10560 [Selenomonadaceae bacterium]|nr:hypothetical protein [Selenomonadaceae bacterium]
MKKFLTVIFTVAFLMSGCGNDSASNDSSKSAKLPAINNSSEAAQVATMDLELYESVGSISYGGSYALKIKGANKIDGDSSKGVAVFDDELYFHFDCKNDLSVFGGANPADCVSVYTFEGMTEICPISSKDGREFWLLMTETGGGGCSTLIGETNDGKWVKYFEEMYLKTMRKLRDKYQLPSDTDYYFKEVYTDDDAIIFAYEQSKTKEICEIIYTWDAAAEKFNVEIEE